LKVEITISLFFNIFSEREPEKKNSEAKETLPQQPTVNNTYIIQGSVGFIGDHAKGNTVSLDQSNPPLVFFLSLKLFPSVPVPKELPQSPFRVLIVGTSPSPKGYRDLEVFREYSAITMALNEANIKWKAEISRITWTQVMKKVAEFRPSILHFSGHGEREGIILFKEPEAILPKANEWDEIPLERLNELAREYGVKGIVLNCCNVGNSGLEKLTSPEWVLAFKTVVGDSTAIELAKKFYSCLENDPKTSFKLSMPTAKNNEKVDVAIFIEKGKLDSPHL